MEQNKAEEEEGGRGERRGSLYLELIPNLAGQGKRV